MTNSLNLLRDSIREKIEVVLMSWQGRISLDLSAMLMTNVC
ncbi:hypothetical protein COLO4_04523 [Corchorus olitorius]|uniref:Uncharacterized protein n=1 Tax=Corchorus olitorius TaxID=93759 RepID=A0A1R3KTL0_9ROSI|nr:hypothetical protein COLO4_04523 [Corchorus olitorius]